MKKIIISNKSTMDAEGKRSNANCKPVYCIDDGKVYASVMDAADEIGVHFTTLSCACLGKTKTCKGKRYCFVSNMSERYEEIARHTREMYADYMTGEAKRQEEERKAEQRKRRAKAEENYAKKLAQANKAMEELDKRKAELELLNAAM